MSGDVYEGNFKDGIYHGKGIYIFKNGDKCYKYSTNADKCDTTKRIIDITEPIQE